MFIKRMLTAIVFLAFFVSNKSYADAVSDRNNTNKITIQVIDRIRSFIAGSNNNEVRNADSQIIFGVRDSFVPNGLAFIDSSRQKKIVITNELTLLLMYLNETALLAISKGETRCDNVYRNYIYQIMPEIDRNLYAGVPIPNILAPEVFGKQNSGPCANLDRYYPFTDEMNSQRTRSVAKALMFMYLHELAHHVLGHTSRSIPNIDTKIDKDQKYIMDNAQEIRLMETNADEWAVDAMFSLGSGADIANIPLFDILTYSSGFDPYYEKFAFHPLGLRRQISILLRHRKQFVQRFGVSQYPSDLENYRKDVERLEAKAEAQYSALRRN